MRARSADWRWKLLRCPSCGGPLRAGPSLCRCARCGPFPVLGEVPLLVPSPSDYCASFGESVLAALAEHGLATREAVRVVQAFAEAGRGEAQRFGDDWTPEESRGEHPAALVSGPATVAMEALAEAARTHGPAAWIDERLGRAKVAVAVAVEVGCGAGARSERMSRSSRRLVVADLSLRAVLRARARAFLGTAEVVGVVMDAEALPLAPGSVDVLVAENLIDLLEDPAAFFEAAARSLARRGRALVTTPEPGLGLGLFGGDDGALDLGHLERVLRAAGLEVRDARDGLPWLRVNSPRHVEAYFVRALELGRRTKARAKSKR